MHTADDQQMVAAIDSRLGAALETCEHTVEQGRVAEAGLDMQGKAATEFDLADALGA